MLAENRLRVPLLVVAPCRPVPNRAARSRCTGLAGFAGRVGAAGVAGICASRSRLGKDIVIAVSSVSAVGKGRGAGFDRRSGSSSSSSSSSSGRQRNSGGFRGSRTLQSSRGLKRHELDEEIPGPEGTKAMLKWLRSKGAKGVEHLQFCPGGGLMLRPSASRLKKGDLVCSVPEKAWIIAEGTDQTADLAKMLLLELWKGSKSEHAPVVRWLRQHDMSSHPVLWQKEELEWLFPSLATFKVVIDAKKFFISQVDALLQWAASENTLAAMPTALRENSEALQVELEWANCISSMYGLPMGNAVGMMPLACEFRYAGNDDYHVQEIEQVYGHEYGKGLLATRSIKPGCELFVRNPADMAETDSPDGMSEMYAGMHLLAYGRVPGDELPGIPTREDLIDALPTGFPLPVPFIADGSYASSRELDEVRRLLKEFADLDVSVADSDDASLDGRFVTFPDECFKAGRILPLLRFMLGPIPEGEEAKIFCSYFKQCHLARYPLSSEDMATIKEFGVDHEVDFDLGLERRVRDQILSWLVSERETRQDALMRISQATGLPTKQFSEGPLDSFLEVHPGQQVLAYYKVKTRDGSRRKSKQPLRARVVSVDETDAKLVFFIDDVEGPKHNVDRDWIIEVLPGELTQNEEEGQGRGSIKALGSSVSRQRIERGRIAMSLLQSEIAHLSHMIRYYNGIIELIDAFTKACEEAEEGTTYEQGRLYEELIHQFVEEVRQDSVEKNFDILQRKLGKMPPLPASFKEVPLTTGVGTPFYDIPPVVKEDKEEDEDLRQVSIKALPSS